MQKYAVEIENVTVKFSNYTALENVNLKIEDNNLISIVGPNGGGKTTLLKVLLGLIKPTTGKVLFFGKDLTSVPLETIGYVPQVKTLDRTFPAKSIELIVSGIKGTWPARISELEQNESLNALEKVGAVHLAEKQLSELSGGELQRVYLARCFVRNPKILVLDEPVTGIDSPYEHDIHEIIENYKTKSQASIIIVTHDWETAYHHSDKVLLLNREMICFAEPKKAFSEKYLRKTFSHIGHEHEMIFGVRNND